MIIKQQFLLFLFTFCCCFFLRGQLDDNYRPVELQGEIPADLLTNVKDQTLKELASKENTFNKRSGREYYALSNYAFKQAMQNGQVYFNDEFSIYLNKIVDQLLKDDPELRKSIRVYATRLSVPNASAWRNGVVFFNIPLLSYMENEAQIAYVLAHEIIHYKKQHVLKRFKKKLDLKRPIINRSKTVDEYFELMRFSRKNELQADDLGFEMILKTDYDPYEALGALEQLQEINSSSVYFSGNVESLFQISDTSFKFDQNCDSTNYDKQTKVFYSKSDQEEEEDEVEVDSVSTHPNIQDRIRNIQAQLTVLTVNNGDSLKGKQFIQSQEQFDRITDMAYFEQIENLYNRGSYVPAMYGSLRMAKHYPQNEFLQETVAKSLYWITKYLVDGSRKNVVPSPSDYTGTYGMFVCYFRNKNSKKLKELALTFLKDRIEKFPDSEEITMQLAKMYAIQGLKEEAELIFAQYLSKFPEGKHVAHAKLNLGLELN